MATIQSLGVVSVEMTLVRLRFKLKNITIKGMYLLIEEIGVVSFKNFLPEIM